MFSKKLFVLSALTLSLTSTALAGNGVFENEMACLATSLGYSMNKYGKAYVSTPIRRVGTKDTMSSFMLLPADHESPIDDTGHPQEPWYSKGKMRHGVLIYTPENVSFDQILYAQVMQQDVKKRFNGITLTERKKQMRAAKKVVDQYNADVNAGKIQYDSQISNKLFLAYSEARYSVESLEKEVKFWNKEKGVDKNIFIYNIPSNSLDFHNYPDEEYGKDKGIWLVQLYAKYTFDGDFNEKIDGLGRDTTDKNLEYDNHTDFMLSVAEITPVGSTETLPIHQEIETRLNAVKKIKDKALRAKLASELDICKAVPNVRIQTLVGEVLTDLAPQKKASSDFTPITESSDSISSVKNK